MVKKGVGADSAHLKSLTWCASGFAANAGVVDVKDGKILRTRNFDFTECYTPEQLNAWTIEARGKKFEGPLHSVLPPLAVAYKHRINSKNRILHPLKRVDWSPENRNTQNRGISKYERISWDEALDYIAEEIKRQYEVWGPGSILCQGDGHGETKIIHTPHGCQIKLLETVMGGATVQARQPDSWEGWYWGAEHVWDQYPTGQGNEQNCVLDISENTDTLLCWGADPETTTWAWGGLMSSKLSYWFTDLGIQQIYICPDVNYSVAVHADKWIPVLPNTDLALQFAIAYVWLTEDLYDKEYVETHTDGFDWLVYEVMGGEDGVPKTPKWAEEKCGVPSRIIKALARRWAKTATSIAHGNGGGFIRSAFSHEPARMEVCLLAMQGLGKPGRNQFEFLAWGLMDDDGSRPLPMSEASPAAFGAYNGALDHRWERFIPKTLVPKAILSDEPIEWHGMCTIHFRKETQFEPHRFPAKDGDPFIHMMWSDSPSWSTCWNCGNDLIRALRSEKMEFVLYQHPWLENDCLFGDIILPSCTIYEVTDLGSDNDQGVPNTFFLQTQAIDQVGESKSDWEIVRMVAERLGVLDEYLGEKTDVDTCIKIGYDSAGVSDYISYEDFLKQEYVSVPFRKDWKDLPRGFEEFCNDPKGHPLGTPTGKLEIYSTNLADAFPDDKERRPYPHYIEESEEHHENLASERAKDYPFLLVSNHPRWRVHSEMDDIPWLRELSKVTGEDGYGYEPVWINPVDAERLGISDGDIVKLYNERGFTLGGAVVTERIMPGVLSQDHGARVDPLSVGFSDRGGANNLICPSATSSKNTAGEVTNGFLVGIEKADMDELRAEFPEAFARKQDPREGLTLSSWVVE